MQSREQELSSLDVIMIWGTVKRAATWTILLEESECFPNVQLNIICGPNANVSLYLRQRRHPVEKAINVLWNIEICLVLLHSLITWMHNTYIYIYVCITQYIYIVFKRNKDVRFLKLSLWCPSLVSRSSFWQLYDLCTVVFMHYITPTTHPPTQ